MASQVYFQNGKYYTVNGNPFGNFGGPATLFQPRTMPWALQKGYIKEVGGVSNDQNNLFNTASISTAYTPNQYTARQLGELQSGALGGGGNTIPHWMQQSFANKMAGFGAPANGPLPYRLTDSSFRGMPASVNQVAPVGVGGKARPAGGV